MGKIVLFNMVTLDGFFEGPHGEIDWHNVDEEFNDFAIQQLNTADGLIFGRKTYQMMASYWPTQVALANDPIVAGKMNSIPKLVFSRTLEWADWNNTRLVKDDAAAEIARLKQESDQNWYIFGSVDLAASLIAQCLIDEYRLMINPLLLGSGRPLFQNGQARQNLALKHARTFQNGNVLCYYHPA